MMSLKNFLSIKLHFNINYYYNKFFKKIIRIVMSSSHLTALLKKNFITWKRSWICSLIEILIPVIFGLILSSFRGLVDIENIPNKSYFNSQNMTLAGDINPSMGMIKYIN